MAEKVIEEGTIDLVGFGRAPWADPDYPKKTLAGRYEDIRQCTSCCYCYSRFYHASLTTCAVNPVFHREHLGWESLPPVTKPKRILIAGGGIAGMEFARVAHIRDHEVVLYEKNDRLGGITNIAADIPYVNTMDLGHIVTWQKTQLEKLGVEVHTGEEVTPELVEREEPDVLVVATGSVPEIPDIPGADLPNVITLDRYLEEKPEIKGKAVVLGSWEPAEVALSLARQGVETTVISPAPEGIFGEGIMRARYFWALYDRRNHLLLDMADAGINIIYDASIERINEQGVEYTVGGEKQFAEVNTVVLGWGRTTVSDLAEACKGKVAEIYILGDAMKVRTSGEAVEDGYRIARTV
jgi:NADPH-dependent 2,4-dienoyl-CoA reductase/sulfur reductase-like enzyme